MKFEGARARAAAPSRCCARQRCVLMECCQQGACSTPGDIYFDLGQTEGSEGYFSEWNRVLGLARSRLEPSRSDRAAAQQYLVC
eukprot:15443288-Alexandrium_andersonii.AAC.1